MMEFITAVLKFFKSLGMAVVSYLLAKRDTELKEIKSERVAEDVVKTIKKDLSGLSDDELAERVRARNEARRPPV